MLVQPFIKGSEMEDAAIIRSRLDTLRLLLRCHDKLPLRFCFPALQYGDQFIVQIHGANRVFRLGAEILGGLDADLAGAEVDLPPQECVDLAFP